MTGAADAPPPAAARPCFFGAGFTSSAASASSSAPSTSTDKDCSALLPCSMSIAQCFQCLMGLSDTLLNFVAFLVRQKLFNTAALLWTAQTD